MKKIVLALMLLSFPGYGKTVHKSSSPVASAKKVDIQNVWARVVGKGKNGAVYMDITLESSLKGDKLLNAASKAAKKVELHTHLVDPQTGVGRMVAVPAIDLAPLKTLTLKPGGMHIMLLGLTGALKVGDTFDMHLTFEQAGLITVRVPVKPLDGSDTPAKKCCCSK